MVKQACGQLPTSADNVALPAVAAARRAAVRHAAAAPGGRRYRSISPACRAHGSKPDGTYGRMPDGYVGLTM